MQEPQFMILDQSEVWATVCNAHHIKIF